MPLLEVVDLWGKVKAGLLQKNPLKGTCFSSKQTFLVTTLLHPAKVLHPDNAILGCHFRPKSKKVEVWNPSTHINSEWV